jgi:hypothetical protein
MVSAVDGAAKTGIIFRLTVKHFLVSLGPAFPVICFFY